MAESVVFASNSDFKMSSQCWQIFAGIGLSRRIVARRAVVLDDNLGGRAESLRLVGTIYLSMALLSSLDF